MLDLTKEEAAALLCVIEEESGKWVEANELVRIECERCPNQKAMLSFQNCVRLANETAAKLKTYIEQP